MDGVRIVYSADLDAAVDHEATEIARGLRTELGATAEVRTSFEPLGAVTVRLSDPTRRAETDAIIKKLGTAVAMRDCEADAICMKVTDEHAQALRAAAIDEAVAVIRKRIASGGLQATVAANGTKLVVDLAGTEDAMAHARDVIARVGRFEVAAVDNNSQYMRSVFQQVEADKAAQEARLGTIETRTDGWRGANGATETDVYILDLDREPLRRYLEVLARSDPSFNVPADRQLGYEQFNPLHGEWSWRTHYLVREGRVSGRTIKSVKSQRDSATPNMQLVIELDKVGAAALQELSTKSVGKKVAIVLDHRVSAPIVAAPLAGGRLTITLGVPSVSWQRDADELVAVLRGGALPVPLREETVSELRGGKVIPPPVE